MEEYPRTGLYKEVWELYRGDCLTDLFDSWTTVEEVFDDGESLDIHILRTGCEGGVEVRQETLYLWLDTGKEILEEKTMFLAELKDLDALAETVKLFMGGSREQKVVLEENEQN